MPTRRNLLKSALLLPALPGLFARQVTAQGLTLPTSSGVGKAKPEYDRCILDFIGERNVPGCAFAIVEQGQTVYTKGYGYRDRATEVLFTPQSPCRLASLTKPLTATVVLPLVERGQLSLSQKVFKLLEFTPLSLKEKVVDRRLYDITIQNCLQMTAGWDRDKNYRGGTRQMAAKKLGLKANFDARTLIRLLLAEPLDFAPGSRQVYSNDGYVCLGRVIEKVTGKSYIEAMVKELGLPMGMSTLKLAHSRKEERDPEEVSYYEENAQLLPSLFPEDTGKMVTRSDGATCIEQLDSAGGLICSLEDLAKFVACITSQRNPISVSMQEQILQPPACLTRSGVIPVSNYGMGWFAFRENNHTLFLHGAVLEGMSGKITSRPDGIVFIVLMNYNNKTLDLSGQLIPRLHAVANKR